MTHTNLPATPLSHPRLSSTIPVNLASGCGASWTSAGRPYYSPETESSDDDMPASRGAHTGSGRKHNELKHNQRASAQLMGNAASHHLHPHDPVHGTGSESGATEDSSSQCEMLSETEAEETPEDPPAIQRGPESAEGPDRCPSFYSAHSTHNRSPPMVLDAGLLHPYNYQAAGHHLMFRYPQGTIVKESTHEEARFYTCGAYIHIFQPFIPQYRGTGVLSLADIQAIKARHRDAAVESNSEDVEEVEETDSPRAFDSTATHSTAGVSVETLPKAAMDGAEAQEGACSEQAPTTATATPSTAPHSPPKRSYSSISPTCKQFIMLKDVTDGYRRPCVIDIKMGIRNFGLNASSQKRRNKIAKTTSTTSYSLGFRLHGMNVYDPRSGQHITRDKMHGRSLRDDTIQPVLEEMLQTAPGGGVNKALCGRLVARLEQLREVFETQRSFHFYTSSLLLCYDHDDPVETASICMVDFAFTYAVSEIQKHEHLASTRDEGYLFGLRNLIKLLNCCAAGEAFFPIPNEASHRELLYPEERKPRTPLSREPSREALC
eukprot:TRINITY_DN6052_c1_g2_i1.p1 TRINITY_DN6052_c1_g2~~TRINITY_DN6052_c1_g2_i1.p1  ORF type:complete len:548 (+),score=141.11 TRINITY_DN6052_c1_g2_i1:35-1678(+)